MANDWSPTVTNRDGGTTYSYKVQRSTTYVYGGTFRLGEDSDVDKLHMRTMADQKRLAKWARHGPREQKSKEGNWPTKRIKFNSSWAAYRSEMTWRQFHLGSLSYVKMTQRQISLDICCQNRSNLFVRLPCCGRIRLCGSFQPSLSRFKAVITLKPNAVAWFSLSPPAE